jgi:PAS domain S-box-containing protein
MDIINAGVSNVDQSTEWENCHSQIVVAVATSAAPEGSMGTAIKSRGQKAAESHITAVHDVGGPFVTAADHTRMPMVFSDPHLPGNPIVYANQSFLSLTGYDRSEVLGQSYHFLMGPETDLDAQAQIEASFRGGLFDGHPDEVRYYRKDGRSFWAVVFIGPVLDAAGKVTQHFVSFLDVTARRKEEWRLRLLLEELNHRTQNTLATVQAIALQTLHPAGPEAVEAFEDRILALSAAHRLLGRTNWEGTSLRAVLEVILEPYGLNDGRNRRFSINGDDVRLLPKLALTFALVFQELATNAAKYGALSNGASGHVQISWQAEPSRRGDLLRLRWQESGGPKVRPPNRKGFGSHLIEGGLAKELRGEVRLDYEPKGVVCEIVMSFPRRDGEQL